MLGALLISAVIFSQTLVNYPLNSNLSPNPAPVVGLNPTLQYFDPPSTTPVPNPNHYFGFLNFENSGDFLQFNFDVAANEDITVKVTAGTAVFLSSISGNIQIFCQVGTDLETKLDEQNLSASGFIDLDNISFSLAVPQAAVPSRIKIRIVGNITSSSGSSIDYFGINNISLVKETTSISVISTKTPAPSFITHSSSASLAKDTDFGNLLTNEEQVEKTYQIKNTGSRDLKISSIDIVPNNQGFTITGPLLTTLTPNQTTTFKVKFAPTDQGISTAEVAISGNIVPDNPFRFEVKGSGKSCNLSPVPIAEYGFEGTAPTNFPVAPISGNVKVIGNTAANPNPNNLGGRLWPNGNLYSADSSTRSWYVRGNDTGEVTFEFGPVDISIQQQVSINFEVAAFGLTDDSNSGVNDNDYVILQVLNPPSTTWIDALTLVGGNNGTRRKYAYGGAETVTKLDTQIYTPVTVNNNNTKQYGKFALNLPTTALSSTFKFRIKAYTSRTRISGTNYNYNLWLIDNVHIDAGNAKVKTWNGLAWSGTENNLKPSPREKAVFDGNYDFTATDNTTSFTICECEVKSGMLTIPNDKALTVRNKIVNNALDNNFIIKDGGNLLQEENSAINTGNITAQKLFTFTNGSNPINDRKQYNYVISPVVGQNVKTIYSGTNTAIYFSEASNFFYGSDGSYIPGRGLGLKEPTKASVSTSTVTANYVGVPYNGNLQFPLAHTTTQADPTNRGYNLVGNPYPSNLDIENLYDANAAKIGATFYFWDNRGNTAFAQEGSGYSGDNYAKYNAASGTGVGSGTKAIGAPDATRIPNRYVKVGTGFILQALSNANAQTLNFNNSMRSNDNSGPGFLGKSHQLEEKDRYWLTLKTPSDIEVMNAVVYFATGSKAVGPEDTKTFGGSDDIFTIVDDQQLTIQGRNQFKSSDIIYLGLSLFQAGTHTISIFDQQGVFANGQTIYLKDILTGTITNLSQGAYSFEASKGEINERFQVIYKPEIFLVTDSVVREGVVIYRDNDKFIIQSPKIIASVEVYDLSGKMIADLKSNNRQAVLDSSFYAKGMYVLRIKMIDGELTNKKILKQ